MNEKDNKVNVYISKDSYNKNKDKLSKFVAQDMVNVVLGTLKVKDKTVLYPGEQIERN
ncbi:hypothetical protein SAMN05444162_0723 [Paenibacillaceae bacterium GAS479]|nr:hypothetical protein SAMN05444162_0723 [Paenibacillaceae bacterium GAS479]